MLSEKFTDGEIKILEALSHLSETSKFLTFTELRNQTRLSKPVLSENLKRLQSKGLVEMVRDGRYKKYRQTEKGKVWINRQAFFRALYESLSSESLAPNSLIIIQTDSEGSFRKIFFLRQLRGETVKIYRNGELVHQIQFKEGG
jgi:DNA-binding MarR family transcriptional regulator